MPNKAVIKRINLKLLLEILREIWKTNKISKRYEDNLLGPIHKKSDETDSEKLKGVYIINDI